jgi:indolepyruvate ferredoxin oxidoreductase, alpha subunit
LERSFATEIEALKLGAGETFQGEGILAVTKALLQSGVSYVGGYQGAPVSHLLDVMVQAEDYMASLGVHVEACTNEASAAALLAASINYPARGAVTWKSIVGTNVAADGLSNLASAGVVGGALIIVGEDYGEGASVIQERTHAFAMKSSLWLLDPRPNLPSIVNMVEHGFALSEASNTPVMMELRIRACHVRGAFTCKDNIAPAVSTRQRLAGPPVFNYDRLAHPPATFRQEKLKNEVRRPAAQEYILAHRLNEIFGDDPSLADPIGLIVQGGLYNNLIRALQGFALADAIGSPKLPVLCLNVVYPLVPEQIRAFCAGKRAVLVLEEGQPEFLEQELQTILRRGDLNTPLYGKDMLAMAGEYTTELMSAGLVKFLAKVGGFEASLARAHAAAQTLAQVRQQAAQHLGKHVPPRPPTFCVGCPERPVFSALKMAQQDLGPMHVSADIGCHAFGTFEPFSMGNSILGYGMSLASAAGVSPLSNARPLAIMGDGGFWHNGLLSGVASHLMNRGDGVLMIMKNGYTSATGTQELISSPLSDVKRMAGAASATHSELTIENTLKGMGVQWMKTVHTYQVGEMKATLTDALSTNTPGLKVIIAEGECQLERQRRIRPMNAQALSRGERVVRVRYGIDEDVCTGDHSCIRISGCPSLTIKDPSDPLKIDPVATINQQCVGCGLCGENAHAATLCPSFYRVEVIQNPSAWDQFKDRIRRWAQALGAPAT